MSNLMKSFLGGTDDRPVPVVTLEPKLSLATIHLGVDVSNAQITEQMRVMKRLRHEKTVEYVTLSVQGFSRDSRELPDIPEARALFGRLVASGFISYLEFTTSIRCGSVPGFLRRCARGLGAFEVWTWAKGYGVMTSAKKSLIDEFVQALEVANRVADRAVGPMIDPTVN